MALNINDFAAAMGSSARSNKFKVQVNFPNSIKVDRHKAVLLTKSGSLPSYSTNDIEVYYRGRVFHEAGEPRFEQWTCEIYNNAGFDVRGALEQWAKLMNDPYFVSGSSTPAEYKRDIIIDQLDRKGNVIYTYHLYGAYPTEVGEITLDYEDDNVERFTSNFVYDYFTTSQTAPVTTKLESLFR